MPSKNNNRIGRIDEEYRKELSQIIGYELKNPNVTGMISVTKVKVTSDLKFAKVYVSILNSKNIKEGDMFIAIKGFTTDGHTYINNAIKAPQKDGGKAVIIIKGNIKL